MDGFAERLRRPALQLVAALLAVVPVACQAPPSASGVVVEASWTAEPAWPDPDAPLWRLAPVVHTRDRPARILLDPGHGAPGNDGNTGVYCQKEGAEMLRIADQVRGRLHSAGALLVSTTRPGGAVVDYGTRIRQADQWADALLSFHSDARAGEAWATHPSTGCPTTSGATGFAVLWSDEGAPPLVQDRQRLAQQIAAALIHAGFPPYDGEDYVGLYEGDPLHPGTFVDRHAPDQRIRMLRRPKVPSIIVETHNAPDPREVDRWNDPRTVDIFADALRVGIDAYLVESGAR